MLVKMNSALQHSTPHINTPDSPYRAGDVDLFAIRHVYLRLQSLRTYKSMSASGVYGNLMKMPVHAKSNELVDDQTVTGLDYIDCSRQTYITN